MNNRRRLHCFCKAAAKTDEMYCLDGSQVDAVLRENDVVVVVAAAAATAIVSRTTSDGRVGAIRAGSGSDPHLPNLPTPPLATSSLENQQKRTMDRER